jgi:hypothetical protein
MTCVHRLGRDRVFFTDSHGRAGAEGLLNRIGGIPELKGIRYWSTTHQQWQTSIANAYASTGSQPDRQTDNGCSITIVRTGRNASRLAAGHESSSINRAVAYYRFQVGIPTDQDPVVVR